MLWFHQTTAALKGRPWPCGERLESCARQLRPGWIFGSDHQNWDFLGVVSHISHISHVSNYAKSIYKWIHSQWCFCQQDHFSTDSAVFLHIGGTKNIKVIMWLPSFAVEQMVKWDCSCGVNTFSHPRNCDCFRWTWGWTWGQKLG